jgi:hypothetical protein
LAVTLTLIVLVTYILWVQRAEVRAWYAERQRKNYRKQQKRREGAKESERDFEKSEER